jgi:hypothetical protein
MTGCGTTSDTTPMIPEIVSIEIDGTDFNSSIHSIIIDQDEVQLMATVSYDDNTSASAEDQLDWESNDTTVLTVLNGLLTPAANNGTAAISASYRDKLFTTKDKNVTIIPLTDINITCEQDLNITVDDTNTTLYHADLNSTGDYTLQANGIFEEDNLTVSAISSNIIWKSSNTSVATVGETTGIISILATGTADINVSVFNDINKTLLIDVNITQ